MTKNRIVVTGGAGFIGSHLIEALVQNPQNNVISLDNYFAGSKDNHIKGATYIEGHTKDISTLIKEKPDIVYHLGEYSRVEQSFDDIKIVLDFNMIGTYNVLEFCRKYNAKIVYAGSSTKYGDGGLGRDQSPYAWTKAANTELVKNYGAWFNLPYAITYFYNVYGSREISTGPYATIIGIFKEQCRNNRPLTVVSPGLQVRHFTHVNDIVAGLLIVGESGVGDEFGLGSPDGYSILDIAKMFGEDIEMLPERKGNRMTSSMDVSKSKALGWKPSKKVTDYIADIVST